MCSHWCSNSILKTLGSRNELATSHKPAEFSILVMEVLSHNKEAKFSSTAVCVIMIQYSKHRKYGVAIHPLSH